MFATYPQAGKRRVKKIRTQKPTVAGDSVQRQAAVLLAHCAAERQHCRQRHSQSVGYDEESKPSVLRAEIAKCRDRADER